MFLGHKQVPGAMQQRVRRFNSSLSAHSLKGCSVAYNGIFAYFLNVFGTGHNSAAGGLCIGACSQSNTRSNVFGPASCLNCNIMSKFMREIYTDSLCINYVSTMYQLYINYVSTIYQLCINYISTMYQLCINYVSTINGF